MAYLKEKTKMKMHSGECVKVVKHQVNLKEAHERVPKT